MENNFDEKHLVRDLDYIKLNEKMWKCYEVLKDLTDEEVKHIFRGLFIGIDNFGNSEDLEMFNVAGKILLDRGINFRFFNGKVLFDKEKIEKWKKTDVSFVEKSL